jgi:hypothetical protein
MAPLRPDGSGWKATRRESEPAAPAWISETIRAFDPRGKLTSREVEALSKALWGAFRASRRFD